MEQGEVKKPSGRMEKTISQKVEDVAKKLVSKPPKKATKKNETLDALKAQKSHLKKAVKNGYTRKEIIAMFKEEGILISARDLSALLGTKKKQKSPE